MATIITETPGAFTQMPSLTIASVGANTKARQTFTITGLKAGMMPVCRPQADLTTGLDLVDSYCVADNTLTLVLWNSTGSPIVQGATTFNLKCV